MRRIKLHLCEESATGWDGAVILTAEYFTENIKSNQLLEELPANFLGQKRALCQSLFLGTLRHGHLIRSTLAPFFRKKPRPMVEAILLVSGFELILADSEKAPKIVHHAVERAKKLIANAELGFLNAVLRKLPYALNKVQGDQLTPIPIRYSHPNWLVKRWIGEFGLDTVKKLLHWNQQTPVNYLRTYDDSKLTGEAIQTTQWQNFYRCTESADWQADITPLLNKGKVYVKDPSTRLAPALLAPRPSENILDLCAAPGGKAFDMAQAMGLKGHITAVDLPSSRIDRLRQNLESLQGTGFSFGVVETDVLKLTKEMLENLSLPPRYDAVMLDAPCSNTGVIQRRTDVKWRLNRKDIRACGQLQNKLLNIASSFVSPNGRLVYSTCSIERAENKEVVDRFLQTHAGQRFKLIDSEISYPWESGHDGAGAFLLQSE